MDVIRVLADDRERNASLWGLLENDADFEVRCGRLEVGDYLLDGQILIERKTLRDFLESLKDQRLFSQASRMQETPFLTAMLLEGTSRDISGTRVPRLAIQGAMVTLAMQFRLPVLKSTSPAETTALFKLIASQHRRHRQGSIARRGKRPKGKRALQSYILQSLPRVGPRKAETLLTRFGSIEAIINASEEDVSTLSGIAPQTARAIKWSIRDHHAEYSPCALCVA